MIIAVRDLHMNNIIHRDIKPHNILMFENNQVKLADFGLAKIANQPFSSDNAYGTLLYAAPETIEKEI